MPPPVFRFAPSPNGYLHLGHAYSALLNFDLARAGGGRFLLRIEDIDATRCRPEFEAAIYEDLAWLGISWETPVRRQSEHFADYREAVEKLSAAGLIYPAFESRAEIARLVAQRETDAPWPRDPDGAPLYPGAAKSLSADARRQLIGQGVPYALRLDMAAACARAADLGWVEHGEGPEGETGMVAARPEAWGDVILARKETPTSYHLSVVIDDALQGVTDVVRGQDLFWSTSVHRLLQSLLGIPQPAYRHHRLVRDAAGQKLSKSTRSTALRELRAAGRCAGRHPRALSDFRSSTVGCQKGHRDSGRGGMPCCPRWGKGDHGGKTARTAYNTADQKAAEEEARIRRCRQTRAKTRGQARRQRAPTPGMVETALAAFAHEVRTPLTGILAISNLLATSDLDERERRWVDTITAGAEHLASLATLFVDAARSGGPGLKAREDFFDLRTLARNAGDSLTGRAAAKGLQSSVEISEKLPTFVVGDPVRLRAALENLIDNAVKFTEQGSVALQVSPLRARKGRIGVAFAVSDSGIGLTLGEVKRLFRPFSQANVSIASRFGGAGLGLSSVKQLARAMGGDIVVTPRRGGGTTFTLDVVLSPAKGPVAGDIGGRWRAPDGRAARPAPAQRRGQSVRPRRAQRHPDRTRPSDRIHRPGRGRAGANRARRLRRGADGHGAAGHQRRRGDPAHPRARIRRTAASRSSACRAAARTRRHRAPPAPTPFWSSLSVHVR